LFFLENQYLIYRASLVPVISFGETELYRYYKRIPWGRSILGYIPLRKPVITIGRIENYMYRK